MNQDTQSNAASAIRILKVGTCKSSNGNALTYHIGCDEHSEVLFRIYQSSGAGYFSQEWISMNAIQLASSKIPLPNSVTSYLLLAPLFKGRSTVTPPYLMQVLRQEGLVRLVEENDRCYERTDGAEFFAEMKTLIESAVDLKVAEKPKKSAPVMAEATIKNSAKKKSQQLPA